MAKAQANEKRREYATKAPDVAPLTESETAERIAVLEAEIADLRKPTPIDFPKWKHHPQYGSVVVPDAAAEHALGAGWCNTPADFPKTKEQ